VSEIFRSLQIFRHPGMPLRNCFMHIRDMNWPDLASLGVFGYLWLTPSMGKPSMTRRPADIVPLPKVIRGRRHLETRWRHRAREALQQYWHNQGYPAAMVPIQSQSTPSLSSSIPGAARRPSPSAYRFCGWRRRKSAKAAAIDRGDRAAMRKQHSPRLVALDGGHRLPLRGPVGVAKISYPSRRNVGDEAEATICLSVSGNDRSTKKVSSRLSTLRLTRTREGQCVCLAIRIHQQDSGLLLTVGERHRVEAISHPRIG
jgi:hypothetical protein